MIIENMQSAPIIGRYNSRIKKISRKLAESYNLSIHNYDRRKLLGFDFKSIKEVKNCKASYNEKENLLEIHWDSKTSFVIPGYFCNVKTIQKYFDIPGLNILREYSLTELNVLKGLGSSYKKAVASAKKLIKGRSQLDSLSSVSEASLEDLANSIADSLSENIDDQVGGSNKKALIDFIKDFVLNIKITKTKKGKKGLPVDNSVDIQQVYDKIFNSTINSTYLEKVVENVADVVEKEVDSYTGQVDEGARIARETINKIVTDAYTPEQLANAEAIIKNKGKKPEKEVEVKGNPAESLLNTITQNKNILSKLSLVKDYLSSFKSMIVNFAKSVFLGISSFDVIYNSIGAYFAHLLGGIVTVIIDLVAYVLGIDPPKENALNVLRGMEIEGGIKDNLKVLAKSFVTLAKQIYTAILGGVEKSLHMINDLLVKFIGSAANQIESLPYIRVCKYIAGAFLIYFFVKHTYKFIKEIKYINVLGTEDAEKTGFRYSARELTKNFGLDKVITSTIITAIIKRDVEKYLEIIQKQKAHEFFKKSENEEISDDEMHEKKVIEKRLKVLIKQINSTGTQRTDEGIKQVRKEHKKFLKNVFSNFMAGF